MAANQYQQVGSTAERLREAMQRAGLRQADLVERGGFNSGGLSCWLKGKYMPKGDALYKLGKILDVSEMWLAGYDVPMERPEEQKILDALADASERAKRDPAFRALLLKAAALNAEQVQILSTLVDQITGPK